MAREEVPDRRRHVTEKVCVRLSEGREVNLQVTFGLTEDERRVREVFCADFKAGTDLHAVITDASVMMSLLLQHGYTATALAGRLGEPPSLLGQVLRAAAKLEAELLGGGS